MKEQLEGWITLHRKLLSNPISDKPSYLAVWVHLLLMASHKETYFIWNNKKQTLKVGQILTGLKKLSKKTGIAQGTVYRILNYLENEKQIEQQKTTKFTVITIVNWAKYQTGEKQNEKQIENRLKTDEKQIETYNNGNNGNKREVVVKKGGTSKQVKPSNKNILLEEKTRTKLATSLKVDISTVIEETEKMVDWLSSKGKVYKDYEAFARNWIRRLEPSKPKVRISNILNTPK